MRGRLLILVLGIAIGLALRFLFPASEKTPRNGPQPTVKENKEQSRDESPESGG